MGEYLTVSHADSMRPVNPWAAHAHSIAYVSMKIRGGELEWIVCLYALQAPCVTLA